MVVVLLDSFKCTLKKKIVKIRRSQVSFHTDNKIQNGIKSVAAEKIAPPHDPLYLNYITFFLIGLLLLLPFNFFTTASKYWMYKFRNTTLTGDNVKDRTWLQIEFTPLIIIIGQTTSMSCNFFATLIRFKLNTKTTILCAIFFILLFFVVTFMFTFINTDSWQSHFFIITMLIMSAINMMKSLINICFYEIISTFPSEYLVPFLVGQGTAGLFSAVLQIISLAFAASPTVTAAMYFGCGIFFVGLTFTMFFASLRSKFFKYYFKNARTSRKDKILSYTDIFEIFKQMWTSVAIMGLVIFTMISVYPSVAMLIVSEGDGIWKERYFVPVTTCFMYYVSDVFGKIIASKVKTKINHFYLVLLTLLRLFLFVPAIMMCNAHPRQNLPILFQHDWQYMIIIITYGISAGYLSNSAFMNVENLVMPEMKTDAFALLTTFNGCILCLSSFMGHFCVQLL